MSTEWQTSMSEELHEEDREKSTKTLRDTYPSGWLALTQNESVPYIIGALLNSLPQREFNQTELAEHAGVSRQSVGRHLDILVDAGIIEPVDETSRQRYRFAPESPVSEALVRLDERSQRQSLSARASCSSPRRHAVLATNTEDETRSGSEEVAGSSMRCSERIRE